MTLSVYRRYNNIGDGLVEQATLRAGGFEPVFQNEHYAYTASLEMLALGGLIMLLPTEQHADANTYLADMQANPITDYDPIAPAPHGRWVRGTVFSGAAGIFAPAVFLPLLFVPALWLLIGGFGLLWIDNIAAKTIGAAFVILAPMLLHAEHIALPRLRAKLASV